MINEDQPLLNKQAEKGDAAIRALHEGIASPAPSSPRDQQWLQECAELVKNKMPESHCFVVFAFPHSGSDRCYYISNAQRASAIEALRQWTTTSSALITG